MTYRQSLTIRVASASLALLGACSGGRPERVDPTVCGALTEQPDACPSAGADTAGPPIPNNCDTLSHPFEVVAEGYVAETITGFGVYEYESGGNQVTSIYLSSCPGGASTRLFSLQYYGVDRLTANSYAVDQKAEEEGGFDFVFTDPRGGNPFSCGDIPRGTVTIDSIDLEQLSGSFEVDARCISEALIGRIPRDVRFTGTFSANNVGFE